MVPAAGTGDGESDDDGSVVGDSESAVSLIAEEVDFLVLVPQPGSKGRTSHAIVKITAEQMRDTRDRECRRYLIDRICLRRNALRRRIRLHRANLCFCISGLPIVCDEGKRPSADAPDGLWKLS